MKGAMGISIVDFVVILLVLGGFWFLLKRRMKSRTSARMSGSAEISPESALPSQENEPPPEEVDVLKLCVVQQVGSDEPTPVVEPPLLAEEISEAPQPAEKLQVQETERDLRREPTCVDSDPTGKGVQMGVKVIQLPRELPLEEDIPQAEKELPLKMPPGEPGEELPFVRAQAPSVPLISPSTREPSSAGQPVSSNESKAEDARVAQEQPLTLVDAGKRESHKTRVAPVKRGGRPRVSAGQTRKKREWKQTTQDLTRELVCWKRHRQWFVGIELPKRLRDQPDLKVFQDGEELAPAEGREACWLLNRIGGDVVAKWDENNHESQLKVSLGEENSLVFKLTGEQLQEGHRVKNISSGEYLILLPEAWLQDEERCGPDVCHDEPCAVEGYHAYFFLIDDIDNQIAFRDQEAAHYCLSISQPRFWLVGDVGCTTGERATPVFFGSPPKLRAPTPQDWEIVSEIVVGQEGPRKGRWKQRFTPTAGLVEQCFPPELEAKRGGWYFARIYDKNLDLIESLDFQFCSTITAILGCEFESFPKQDGYEEAVVKVFHDPSCEIALVSDQQLVVEREKECTLFKVPPDHHFDKLSIRVRPRWGSKQELDLLVERVWWGLGEAGKEPEHWQDTPIQLRRRDFEPSKKTTLWIRFPRPGWVDAIEVGLEQNPLRRHPVKKADKTLPVLLHDFWDEVSKLSFGEHNILIRLSRQEKRYKGNVARIVVEIPCKHGDKAFFHEEDLFSDIKEEHLEEHFCKLSYEELTDLDSSLPRQILLCSYCNQFYSPSEHCGDYEAMERHQKSECPGVLAKNDPNHMLKFIPVKDIDVIREKVLHELKPKFKCRYCNKAFEEDAREEMLDHLVKRHREKLSRR